MAAPFLYIWKTKKCLILGHHTRGRTRERKSTLNVSNESMNIAVHVFGLGYLRLV